MKAKMEPSNKRDERESMTTPPEKTRIESSQKISDPSRFRNPDCKTLAASSSYALPHVRKCELLCVVHCIKFLNGSRGSLVSWSDPSFLFAPGPSAALLVLACGVCPARGYVGWGFHSRGSGRLVGSPLPGVCAAAF